MDNQSQVLAKYSGKCARCGQPFSVGTPIFVEDKRWYVVGCKGCAARELDFQRLIYRTHEFSPGTDDELMIEITCHCRYESPGRHDTWGPEWIVRFPKLGIQTGKYNRVSKALSSATQKLLGWLEEAENG